MSMARKGTGATSALLVGLGLATGWILAGSTPAARACGGFFCNLSQPVDQSAEEIIFVDNGDDTTTMLVRIVYEGPSEKFAWLLPVSGTPEVALSSEQVFDRLRNTTDPRYDLEREYDGDCEPNFQDAGAAFDGSAPDEKNGAVMVLDMGEIGPFVYTTIGLDPDLPDAADVAVTWLTDNGYDVTSLGADVLRPYLAEGLNLIAFKLTNDARTSAIRPVQLTYAGSKPSIPIRPTAVAAVPDMGVRVWILGENRAIPRNYKSLELNEALINWFNWRENYDEVVTEAANQAGGQGFVTEKAGSSDALANSVVNDYERSQWQAYSARTFDSPLEAMQEARWPFGQWRGWTELICENLQLPSGVSCADWGATASPDGSAITISAAEFVDQLWERVVRPVFDAQDLLLSRPYVTRLYTTLSAEEMTDDPAFDFNADLPDVDNVHTAKLTVRCQPGLSAWESPFRVELPGGETIVGVGQDSWPIELADLPANRRILQLGTRGAGEVVLDNNAKIAAGLDGTAKPPRAGAGGIGGGGGTGAGGTNAGTGADQLPSDAGVDAVAKPAKGGDDDGPFCSVRGAGAGARGRHRSATWALLVVVAVVLRRRRARSA